MIASPAEKYRLLLMVSQAANAYLDLGSVRAYVRTPLTVRAGLLGSITFARLSDRTFNEDEVEVLEEVTRPIAGQ